MTDYGDHEDETCDDCGCIECICWLPLNKSERDKRASRLRDWATGGATPDDWTGDLQAELSASLRDREALAEARELLREARRRLANYSSSLGPRIGRFLKRTEASDE